MHNKFGSNYEEFIFYRTYSRWNYEKERRYNWTETVDRYYDFFRERVPKKLLNTYEVGKNFILKKDVLPSMRALWTAGEALEKHNLAGYNCSFLTISYPKAFADILFLLMNGTGVGFSVERQFIINLPDIPSVLTPIDRTIVFEDSKEGWGEGYYELIKYLYEGYAPKWDLSKVRPEGAILKTFGGRASGARPLNNLLKLTIGMFQNARGRKLNSLECHDLVCHISECVIVGGTRRSACISFSNLSDQRMKNAKQGSFWETNPQRMMANNSVAYTEKPDMKIFMEEWLSLATSGTGERGIFNVESCKKIFELNGGRREFVDSMRTNPCSEVVLRPKGLCNLTEIVVRPNDTLNMLIKKAKTATMLGMLQSTLTDFVFVDSDWKRNCEEERLLGVSLTGTYDHPILNSVSDRAADWLQTLKATVIDASQKWSTIMGVNMPVATTCVKPSGTVSQLVNSSSGIHPRYSKYYIRRVRSSRKDPISQLLIDNGVPWNPEIGQSEKDATIIVFDFPIKSPESSVIVSERTALQQLEYWKMFQLNYCEHKPSFTCYVKDDEWLEVGAWCYKNWDILSGVSFLPDNGGIYQLAPYEEINKDKFEELESVMPHIDFNELENYEKEDYTSGSREFACTGGVCEL